jgi:hypothetical protein
MAHSIATGDTRTQVEKAQMELKVDAMLQMRLTGAPLWRIGEAFNHSPQYCGKLIRLAISNIARESATELLELEFERLDMLWEAALNLVKTDPSPAAIASAAKILERRAKLAGLDAPSKTEVTGADGGPIQNEWEVKVVHASLNEKHETVPLKIVGGTDGGN